MGSTNIDHSPTIRHPWVMQVRALCKEYSNMNLTTGNSLHAVVLVFGVTARAAAKW